MYTPLLIFIVLVAFALILIVMVQNPKGGGLSSTFGGNVNTIGGVQNTNNFLDRATWTLAVILFASILLAKFTIDKKGTEEIGVQSKGTTELDGVLDGTKVLETPAAKPAEKAPVKEETKKEANK